MKKFVTLMMLVAVVALSASSVMAATITIQPDPTAGKDVRAREAFASNNYGTDISLAVRNDSGHDNRTFIQFDFSGIPTGQTIDSVTLSLYKKGDTGSDVIAVDIYQVTASWTESVLTWNNRPSHAATVLASRNMSGTEANGWKTWSGANLTSMVQDWYDGTTTNYGLTLRAMNTGDSYVTFWSSDYTTDASLRPKLDITYTPEPATMSLLLLGLPLALRRRRK